MTLRVMYVAANPEGGAPLQVEREVNDLQDRLDRGTGAEPIDFRAYPHLAIGDLIPKIAAFRPHVLHLSAHAEDGALVFARGEGGDVAVDGRSLSAVLRAVSVRPQLIVVNACSSEGLAAVLVADGAADFVIGTDAPITNDGARAMAVALYQRLADASSLADAFTVAATQLNLLEDGAVSAILHPDGGFERAKQVRLVDPLRIVACLPSIERCLNAGSVDVGRRYRPEQPDVLFGLAGVPAAARRTVLFTDDEQGPGQEFDGGGILTLRKQPREGVIWMLEACAHYRDLSWFASVTTTDRRIASAVTTTAEALERHYFSERWRGELPEPLALIVRKSIDSLIRCGRANPLQIG